ncbi:MAG: 50S ribosomal protein L30 [Myxococcota bacterium]
MAARRLLKITLARSPIGSTRRQRATLRGLGLRRVGKSVACADTPATRGMVRAVAHLLAVEGEDA